jgi:hypothetical protein
MTNLPALQAVTANDLIDGDVVYLTAELCWSRHLTEAVLAETPGEAARLLAGAVPQEHLVVGPYLIDVARDADGRPEPTHYRERIRTLGPSNRPDLGRQAETPAVRRQESAHVSL